MRYLALAAELRRSDYAQTAAMLLRAGVDDAVRPLAGTAVCRDRRARSERERKREQQQPPSP